MDNRSVMDGIAVSNVAITHHKGQNLLTPPLKKRNTKARVGPAAGLEEV